MQKKNHGQNPNLSEKHVESVRKEHDAVRVKATSIVERRVELLTQSLPLDSPAEHLPWDVVADR